MHRFCSLLSKVGLDFTYGTAGGLKGGTRGAIPALMSEKMQQKSPLECPVVVKT